LKPPWPKSCRSGWRWISCRMNRCLLSFETNFLWPLHLYGITKWTDFFTPRQLFCHGAGMEIFRELVNEATARADGLVSPLRRPPAMGLRASPGSRSIPRWSVSGHVRVERLRPAQAASSPRCST
jgi:hypothetical protein